MRKQRNTDVQEASLHDDDDDNPTKKVEDVVET